MHWFSQPLNPWQFLSVDSHLGDSYKSVVVFQWNLIVPNFKWTSGEAVSRENKLHDHVCVENNFQHGTWLLKQSSASRLHGELTFKFYSTFQANFGGKMVEALIHGGERVKEQKGSKKRRKWHTTNSRNRRRTDTSFLLKLGRFVFVKTLYVTYPPVIPGIILCSTLLTGSSMMISVKYDSSSLLSACFVACCVLARKSTWSKISASTARGVSRSCP